MRPRTTNLLEWRRRQAIRLLRKHEKRSVVARCLGTTKASLCRWWQTYQRTGFKGLKAKSAPGRPSRLSERQRKKLCHILLEGPLACGYRTDLWTLKRVAEVIHKVLHIKYRLYAVWHLLHEMGWSCQKPEKRAYERSEKAIKHWKRYVWPHIRKKAQEINAHIVFLDETGFLLIPNVRRTWSPSSKTPIVNYSGHWDKISAVTALSASPRKKRLALYFRFYPRHNINHRDIARFLQHLLRHLQGPIILLWDSGRTHRGPALRALLTRYPRLQTKKFPGYAPELDPAEFVWAQMKQATTNATPENIVALKQLLQAPTDRLRHSQRLLGACISASELPWAN